MVRWRAIFVLAAVVCLLCSAGCIEAEEPVHETNTSSSLSEPVVLKTYGQSPDRVMLNTLYEWRNTLDPKVQAYMNDTVYPNGPVLGWSIGYYYPLKNQTVMMFVGENLTDIQMDEIYAVWNSSASDAGVVSASGIPMAFIRVPIPEETAPIQILILNPWEGTLWYSDVVPHEVRVGALVLSNDNVEAFYVKDVVNPKNWDEITTASIPITTGCYGSGRVFIPGDKNVSLTLYAVDNAGNTAEKTVNVTIRTSVPPPGWKI